MDFKGLRPFGYRLDAHDPYLYFLEVRDDRALHVAAERFFYAGAKNSSAPLPSIRGFPMPATMIADAPPRPAEDPVIRVFLASGKPRDVWNFTVMPSGRVILDDYESSLELRLASTVVPALLDALETCGVCDLNRRLARPPFGVRDMTIELRPDSPTTCWSHLSWADWTGDADARRCLDAVRDALRPASSDRTAHRFP